MACATVSSRLMPQPMRTLGTNSWSGALASSSGSAGLLSIRQRRITSAPLSVTSGGGTVPPVSMSSGRFFGEMVMNSLRKYGIFSSRKNQRGPSKRSPPCPSPRIVVIVSVSM